MIYLKHEFIIDFEIVGDKIKGFDISIDMYLTRCTTKLRWYL